MIVGCLIIQTKGLFGYYLFYWNWKFIAKNTVDKGKN